MASKKSLECLVMSIIVFGGLVACSFVSLKYFSSTYLEIRRVEDRFPLSDAITAKQCKPVCTSKECLRITKHLFTYIDISADPCQDFYNFSCGNYFNLNYPSYGDVSHNVLKDSAESMDLAIKQFLETYTENQKSATIGKIRKVFNRCMNRTTSDGMSIKGTLSLLWKIGLRGWPHLPSDWTIRNTTPDVLLSHFNSMDSFSFIRLSFDDGEINYDNAIEETDNKTPEKVLVDITTDDLFLSASVYLSERNFTAFKEINDYKQLIQNVLHLFGVSHVYAKEISEQVVQLEKKIAKVFDESENAFGIYKRNVSSNETFYFNCSRSLPSSGNRWCSYLHVYMSLFDLDVSAFNFSSHNFILLDRLKDFLDEIPHKNLADFLSVQFILSKSKSIRGVCRLILKYNKLSKVKSDRCDKGVSPIRWKFCARWIADTFDVAVGSEFISAVYNGTLPEEILTTHERVKRAAIATIQKIAWVTEEDKICILELINSSTFGSCSIKTMFAFNIVDEFYSDLLLAGESFVENLVEYEVFLKGFKYKTYFKRYHPIIKTDFFKILESDLFIMPRTFLISTQIGILRFPFFGSPRPPHINMRTIGFGSAHEYGHAFSMSLEFCVNKTTRTGRNHELKKSCLINQYSKYKIGNTDVHVNGSRALQENFADNFSLLIGEIAYEAVKTEYGSLWLPSIKFSDEQLRFIFFSQLFCEIVPKTNLEELKLYYSPFKYRVLGPLANTKDFLNSFSCASDKRINQNETCSLF